MDKHLRTTDATYAPSGHFFLLDELFQARDLEKGVPKIASLFHEVCDQKAIRATYYTLETSRTIPAWKWGSMWCARKSVVAAKIWSEERKSFSDATQESLVRTHLLLTALLRLLPTDGPTVASLSYDDAQFMALLFEIKATVERFI